MSNPPEADERVIRPTRRSQPERRAAMRARLLDATVECLVEVGWARTTLPEVVARAGVARGAQVHHFPTKASLVEAVGEHLLVRQQHEFAAHFDALPAEERTPAGAIDALWALYATPTWTAVMELTMAARTDPAAALALRHFSDLGDRSVLDDTARMFQSVQQHPAGVVMVRSLVATLMGLAFQRSLNGGDEAHASQVVELLKGLSGMLTPSGPAPPASG